MIHFIKEGDHLHLGLNITFGRVNKWWPWVTFLWCWYDVKTRTFSAKRLRFRSHVAPRILRSSRSSDVVDNYLLANDLIAVPRELLEDHAPKIVVLAQYFNQQYKTGVIGRYNG